MSKRGSVYYPVTAVCAALILSVVQGLNPVPTSAAPAITASVGSADLTAEARTIDSFGDALSDFDKKCAELDKKAVLTRAEYDLLKTSGDDLNGRLAQVRQAFESVKRKLIDAKEWDNFDTTALQTIKYEPLRAFLRREGGARHVLEAAAAQTGDVTSDINTWRDRLKVKVRDQSGRIVPAPEQQDFGWRIIGASYTPNTPAVFAGGKCFFSKVRLLVSSVTHGGCPTDGAISSSCVACGNSSALDCPNCNLN